jgi:hypothetical protein
LVRPRQELVFSGKKVSAYFKIDAPKVHRLVEVESPVASKVIGSCLGRHQDVVRGATLTLQKYAIVLEETAFELSPHTRGTCNHSSFVNGTTILVWRVIVLTKWDQPNDERSVAHPQILATAELSDLLISVIEQSNIYLPQCVWLHASWRSRRVVGSDTHDVLSSIWTAAFRG